MVFYLNRNLTVRPLLKVGGREEGYRTKGDGLFSSFYYSVVLNEKDKHENRVNYESLLKLNVRL